MPKVKDVTVWLENQVGRDYHEVLGDGLELARQTRKSADESIKGRRTPERRAFESAALSADRRMGHFLFFVQHLNMKPAGVSEGDWAIYQEIVAAWIEKKQVKPETLSVFGY